MKVVVTGGAGFIGSHLVDAYVNLDHEVFVIDNLSTGFEANINSKAKFHNIDLTNTSEIEKFFSENKIDFLNHHSAQLNVRVSVSNPKFDAEQNIIGTINLLQAALKNDCKKVLFASSAGTVYGDQLEYPCDESHPNNPISPYGISKLTIEKFMYYYHKIFNIDCIGLRYTNVYGVRQNPLGESGVIAIFCEQMKTGINPIIYGNGLQTRDYVNVKDVVKANLIATNRLLNIDNIFDLFNVSSNSEVNVNNLFKILNSFHENKYSLNYKQAKEGEQFRSCASYHKIKSDLGWEPKVSLIAGLEECVKNISK
ncbi:MAG: NAD-dependent epimerase/dehydratase family protein [Chlorobiota bacterium]|nr:NAD-dependent epimerase/dehydratase family protein [Chlorobiota bacterium]QQS67480.1 MAG: NAD-dependent epimerase/dehydratase family protein [Chlorobiota bacterium]